MHQVFISNFIYRHLLVYMTPTETDGKHGVEPLFPTLLILIMPGALNGVKPPK